MEALCQLVPVGADVGGRMGPLEQGCKSMLENSCHAGAVWTRWEGKSQLSCKNVPQFAQTCKLDA